MTSDDADRERMNDLEALMWRLGADPHLSSTFANVTFLDRSPDFERFRRRMWRASRNVSRLRRRVVERGPLSAPEWEDDPDFDIDRHVRRVVLPVGATDEDARAFTANAAGTPFDRERPLWEFTILDGLPNGRAAMVQKMHHTITDGKGGIRLSIEFIDLDRDAPEPPPVDDGPPPAVVADEAGPSLLAGAFDVFSDATRRSTEAALRLAGSAGDLLRDPAHLASLLASLPAESAATAQSLVRQLVVVDQHRSPLWTARSLDRRLDTFDVPLSDAKEASALLGGSVNDLFVAAAAGGAGTYHRDRGVDVDELRMSMPISTRTDRAIGGNAFTPTRVLVPIGADPRARFTEIHDRLAVTKGEKALTLVSSLAGLTNLLPSSALTRLARQQVMTVDFATSNVRAAPFDIYMAGALAESNYPAGPVAGTAWNLTTMSYRGVLNMGLHTDTTAVAEPKALAAAIADSFAELIEVARSKPRRSQRKPKP
ncbi:MAG: wax ester/triacylglycerol synthase domain-containing protein [Aquihabitans sp.]